METEIKIMIIYVDIDETICITNSDRDYTVSKPIQNNIDIVNALYAKGHRVVYWTSRGTGTGADWFHLTINQLTEWGCKYHELRMGKPLYDLFIDDKNINVKDIDKLESYLND